ncbi:BatA domain-containing protein [Stieleria varia]|uniref:Aerotolerance regulator N-terminal domain-containing protein n=1 Tax=Stieleria varia TaxID=2528005 RepID=A0A5C6ANU8_9BACT|nr:BatA domain-containing protein [Stieleria varia]TWU00776.1 hypothetical protein Pla52n_41450 [Stieleria varia]
MSFLQIGMLAALPLVLLPVIIHLINQWRYQTKQWGAMMFLLKANKMARGYAKLRQWLIMAARMLVIAGLIFAIARPLASGLLGWSAGGRPDTTILLLDRSPSMQQAGRGGQSKLETGRRQIADALKTLGSTHWVLIDSATMQPQSFESLEAMIDAPSTDGTSAAADIPGMLQATVDYLNNNQPGASEVWLCSDLRSADWQPDSGRWKAVREAFAKMPQTVRFHLVAYPESADSDASIRVLGARRTQAEGNAVLLSMQVSQSGTVASGGMMPVRIEIDGATTELNVEMTGNQVTVRDYRVPLAGSVDRGWGKVSIPADSNAADNEAYFVFADPPARRVVLVTDDREASAAIEIAAAISPDGKSESTVEVMAPETLDSLVLDDAAVLIWQAALPDDEISPAVKRYVDGGGQVLFFPPSSLSGGLDVEGEFLGVSWQSWVGDEKALVENWRGDQDLLAATGSGVGLPVGQLEINEHAKLGGEFTQLATLSGGDPLLVRVPTARGGVYFCTATAASGQSTLASNGIVLYVAVQRAIRQGLDAIGQTGNRVAGSTGEDAVDEDASSESSGAGQGSAAEEMAQWRQIAGPTGVLSSEYTYQAGVYQATNETTEKEQPLVAVNRSVPEDQRDTLTDSQLSNLFAGLDYSRVDDSAGGLEGIVQEIWRFFLILMIAAMLLEALLCIPRRRASAAAIVGRPDVSGFKKSDSRSADRTTAGSDRTKETSAA